MKRKRKGTVEGRHANGRIKKGFHFSAGGRLVKSKYMLRSAHRRKRK